MCLLAVLGSQGIVVQCPAATFVGHDGLALASSKAPNKEQFIKHNVLSHSREQES